MKFIISTLSLLMVTTTALPTADPATLDIRANACSKAATDSMLFSASMKTFQSRRNHKSPKCFDWSSDGCSKSPDHPDGFNFVPSCQRHDFGYRNMKKQKQFTKAMKSRVDKNLKKDLYKMCSGYSGLLSFRGVECRRIADIYYEAVKHFGKRDEVPLDPEAPLETLKRDPEAETSAMAEAEALADAVDSFDPASVVFDDVPEFDESSEDDADLPEVVVEE